MKIALEAHLSPADVAELETQLGLPPNTLVGKKLELTVQPTEGAADELARHIGHSLLFPKLRATIAAAEARWQEHDAVAAHKASPLGQEAAVAKLITEFMGDQDGPTWPPDELDDLLTAPVDWPAFHRDRLCRGGEAVAAFWLLDVWQEAAFQAVAKHSTEPDTSPDWLLIEFPIRRRDRRTDLNDALERLADAVGAARTTYGTRAGGLALGAGAAWLARYHWRGDELAAEFCRTLGHLGDIPAHESPELLPI
jgi:hypothetical protein